MSISDESTEDPGAKKPSSEPPTKGLHFDPTIQNDSPTPEFGALASSDEDIKLAKKWLDERMNAGSGDDVDPLLGQKVGNYEVVRLLGRGGFGAVYKARDFKLDRWAALKFLRVQLDSEHRKWFQREAKVIANLAKNPLIVQIYEWGEHQGNYYFALEYLEGSADKLVTQHADGLPVAQALAIAADCAAGLAYAHERDVLHRDIKPANILIDEETGRAKLADFGLARFYNMGMSSQSGVIAGSPSYMSPEQASGDTVDQRSDVYSLGVTLYQLLSGNLPFRAKSSHEMLEQARRGGGTPLPKYRPDLPREICDLVSKATEKKPANRFQTAKEFESALRKLLREISTTGSTGGASSMRRRPERAAWGVIAVTALIVAAVVGTTMNSRREPADETPGPAQGPRTSPDLTLPYQSSLNNLNLGEYDNATTSLSEYLKLNPGDANARYALGFAHYLNGQVDDAEATFQPIVEPTLRADADAMILHARKGGEARTELEGLAEASPYAGLLLGALDLSVSNFEGAVSRLSAIDLNSLQLDWQKGQCQQLLGRAYLKLADYAAAFDALNAASGSKAAPVAEMARVFADMAKQQLEGDRRDELRAQIEELKAVRAAQPDEPVNMWTSRPIRIWIKPGESSSPMAEFLGLPDSLPGMLAMRLAERESETLIGVVNRENLSDILAEQMLYELEQEIGRTAVGQLLGARVLAVCDYRPQFGEDYAKISLTDIETSRILGAIEAKLSRGLDPAEWTASLERHVVQKIHAAYPLQAVLTADGKDAVLDIGNSVGLEAGMDFDVYPQPNAREPIGRFRVIVAEPPGADSARVQTEGFEASGIPDGGWYVRERIAEEPLVEPDEPNAPEGAEAETDAD